MGALIPIILANLPAIMSTGQIGWNFIMGVRRAAMQTGEWTAEHDAQFLAGVEAWATDPAWLPDSLRRATAAPAARATPAVFSPVPMPMPMGQIGQMGQTT